MPQHALAGLHAAHWKHSGIGSRSSFPSPSSTSSTLDSPPRCTWPPAPPPPPWSAPPPLRTRMLPGCSCAALGQGAGQGGGRLVPLQYAWHAEARAQWGQWHSATASSSHPCGYPVLLSNQPSKPSQAKPSLRRCAQSCPPAVASGSSPGPGSQSAAGRRVGGPGRHEGAGRYNVRWRAGWAEVAGACGAAWTTALASATRPAQPPPWQPHQPHPAAPGPLHPPPAPHPTCLRVLRVRRPDEVGHRPPRLKSLHQDRLGAVAWEGREGRQEREEATG